MKQNTTLVHSQVKKGGKTYDNLTAIITLNNKEVIELSVILNPHYYSGKTLSKLLYKLRVQLPSKEDSKDE